MAGESILNSGEPTAAPTAGTQGEPGTNPAPKETPEGTPEKSWRDELPTELREHKSLEKFQDHAALAKSYIELEKHVGGTLKIPDENATQSQWDAYYTKLGRPETPEGYEIKAPENLPQGLEWQDDAAKGFTKVAHEAGLSKKQVESVFAFYQDHMLKQAEGFWTSDRGMAALETRYPDAEERNAVVGNAQRLIREHGDNEIRELLDQTGLGNHPAVLKLLAAVGKTTGEDRPGRGEATTPDTEIQMVREEIARIKNDPTSDYRKGKPEAVAYMSKLYEKVYGRKVVLEVMK